MTALRAVFFYTMALAASQYISRVVPFKPFGDGSDGAYNSATIPSLTKYTCTGTSGTTTLTAGGTGLANNDLILIHQSRGSNVGKWEVNMVASGGGSASLTMQENLANTYYSGAQVTKIPQYTDVTVASGTWNVSGWGGSTGGLFVMASNGTITVTGTISSNGDGFRGGAATGNNQGYSGEGAPGGGSQTARTANGNGGGAGGNWGPGGGGGNGTAGTNGYNGTPGYGGGTDGSADLTDFVFGGGGGAGSYNNSSGNGATGGGGVFIFAKDISITGGITATGNNSTATSVCGGSGAGGSTIIMCATGTLGSNKITATGGIRVGEGGTGGSGRVAVHHSGTITGTTTPTFSNVTDGSLVEPITYSKNTSTTGNSLTTYYCGQNYDNTAPGTPGGVNRGFNS